MSLKIIMMDGVVVVRHGLAPASNLHIIPLFCLYEEGFSGKTHHLHDALPELAQCMFKMCLSVSS